jgi:hypothetical protein
MMKKEIETNSITLYAAAPVAQQLALPPHQSNSSLIIHGELRAPCHDFFSTTLNLSKVIRELLFINSEKHNV